MAPPDQQQESPFRGDEPYAFENLHPQQPRIAGRLPGLGVRVFATHGAGPEEQFQEIPARLMALWFFPAEERVIQVFQGWMEVREDDASDITHLLAAIERTGQPRPAEHYRDVRDRRLDKRNGPLEALRESDLVPADLAVSLFPEKPAENPALTRGLERARRERIANREMVASYGLDPDEHGPPVDIPPPPEIRTIEDLIAAREKMEQESAGMAAHMAAEKEATVASVRAVFDREGKDFSVIEKEMAGELTRGPPPPAAPRLIGDLQGIVDRAAPGDESVGELRQMLADPEIIASWHQADVQQLAGYRAMGHLQGAADTLDRTVAAELRERVAAHHAQGGSLAGWDLTGADLAGMDLRGADLSQALLECADLSVTRLDGASPNPAIK